MGRATIKLTDKKTNIDYYLEWSSVVDAPVTNGMSLEEFKEYFEKEYGTINLPRLESRLKKVEETGTSSSLLSLESLSNFNHAGHDGRTLSIEEIINKYCICTHYVETKFGEFDFKVSMIDVEGSLEEGIDIFKDGVFLFALIGYELEGEDEKIIKYIEENYKQ